MNAKEAVQKFWDAMNTNDFHAASQCLAPDFVLHWPQSRERIVGRENFALVNSEYPANGQWRFTINTIISDGTTVVTDTSVTDGTVTARALTFSTVIGGLITEQVEYWPDDYEAPAWRRAWVELEE